MDRHTAVFPSPFVFQIKTVSPERLIDSSKVT